MSDKNFMSYGDAEPLFAELGSELEKRVEQYSTMPSASSTLLNKIVQYIGTTSESYINGLFYKCVYNAVEADYEWVKIDMSGGSGIAITATLLASGWNANNQQTIIFDGYSSNMNGVIGVPASATSAQKTAYTEAIINVVSQSGNSFTFEATNVPSIDLPVVVYAGGGNGSGGTNVEPNPIGTPTDELVTIRIKDDIYSLAGGCEAIEKTQAQYNALSESEKLDPKKVYYITDGGGGGGASALSELTDVELTDLADGEILKYDATEEKWVNAEDGGSGGGSVVALPSLYSTKEKMVGLWTDNKPLYQKTIKSTTTPSANAWNQIALPTNISVKSYCGYYVRSTGAINKISAYREDVNPAEMLYDSITNSTYYYRISSPFIANFSELDLTIQYTKTTDTPVEDFNLQDFGIFAPAIYSTEEREIGVWTNGKPLYEKTYYENNVVNGTVVTIQNADKVLIKDAYSVNANGNLCIPYSYDTSNADYHFVLYADGQSIKTETTNVWVNTYPKVLFTVQYTKTTDVAGSGSYTELGVPAVHYDDTERVIGTWFGETLYQKTIDCGVLPNSTSKNLTTPSNIKYVVSATGFCVHGNDVANQRPLPFAGGGTNDIRVDMNNGSLRILTFSDWSSYNGYLIVKYTKTS